MKMSRIWSFIEDNSDFFKKMSKKEEINIDFKKHTYTIGDRWMIDPFFMILYIFRRKFEVSGPSSIHEFTRMNKIAYKSNIKFPFGKREYDDYVNKDTSNQRVLYTLEESIGARDNRFVIPTKEHATASFKNVSDTIENVLSGMFMYEQKEARYYIDLYDRVAGFEIFLDNGSIFIPAKDSNIERPTLYEDRLRGIDLSSRVEIFDMDMVSSVELTRGRVFVSSDAPESVSNIAKYFRTFDISSDNSSFIFRITESLYLNTNDEISVTVGSVTAVEYAASEVIRIHLNNKNTSIPYIVDIVKCLSGVPEIEKEVFINIISSDIDRETLAIIRPYLAGNNDNHESRMLKIINSTNIELCARVIRLNGESSSIVFYNKKMKYFKEFSIDRQGMVNDFIPDIGGFRYISTYCDIDRDKIPQGYSSVDAYVTSIISRIIHREFSSLPLLGGYRSSGVHYINNTPIFGHSDGVMGLNGKHSIDGILIESSPVSIGVPKIKPSKKQIVSSMDTVVDACKGFIVSDYSEYKYFAIMIMSSVVTPLLSKSNKFVATIVGANKYIESGLEYRVFRGVFSNARMVNTDSEYVIKKIVDGSSSILVTDDNKNTKKILRVLARERLGSEHLTRLRGSDMIKKTVNTSPILMFAKKELIIDDAVVFNFRPRVSSISDSRLYSYSDESGNISSFIFSNLKRIHVLENKFVSAAKEKVKSNNIIDKNSYIDFFEKILPAMCLVEVSGYMSGKQFHDDMMSIFFTTRRIRKSLKIDRLVLELNDGKNKVEDKVFDSILRSSQYGDMVFVDKIFHRSYIDNEDSDMFVFIFDIVKLYELSRSDIDISFVEFLEAAKQSDGYIGYENAIRNWKMGYDKNISVYGAYKEYFGEEKKNRDNFCAIRMQKKSILSI